MVTSLRSRAGTTSDQPIGRHRAERSTGPFWSRRRADIPGAGSQVVPPGFDVLARAVLINDRDRMITAVRGLAQQRAADGAPWRSFRADLERTWRALGRTRPPRIVVKTAETVWAATSTP